MGFRFRKSINLGGGFKINLSKSGVGYSWGTKGARFTKTAKGKNRTTLSIPGTGISYVSESGSKRKSSERSKQTTSTNRTQSHNKTNLSNNGSENYMTWFKFVICLFFGFFGVHKFMEKKIGMGLLYLFTIGLFGFGWIFDCVMYLIGAIKGWNSNAVGTNNPIETVDEQKSVENYPVESSSLKSKKMITKVLLWVVTVFFGLMGLVNFTSGGILSGLLAFALIALIIPIDGWQAKLKTIIKGKIKPIIAFVLVILCFATVPSTEAIDVDNTAPTATTAPIEDEDKATAVTEAETVSKAEQVSELTADKAFESTVVPTTELNTDQTAESTTDPVTESANNQITEPTADQTPESAKDPASESTDNQITTPATDPETESTTEPTTEDVGMDYVLNKNTGKFHYPSCSSADDIKPSNRWDYHGTREEIVNMGYQSCGRCHP